MSNYVRRCTRSGKNVSFRVDPRAKCEGNNEESQVTTNAFPRVEIPPLRCTQGRDDMGVCARGLSSVAPEGAKAACPAEARKAAKEACPP